MRGIRLVATLGLNVLLIGLLLLPPSVSAEDLSDGSGHDAQAEEARVLPAGAAQRGLEAVQADSPSVLIPQFTNGKAATGNHEDLERAEALDLFEDVFQPVIDGIVGPFDELQIERFLSDNVAVIASEPQEQGGDGDVVQDRTLIHSTVPLREVGPAGTEEPVDLSLEHHIDSIQPTNPLVDVEIPNELGEGIDLPGVDVEIGLAGAPAERVPSTTDSSIAFYPNVAEDTDFVVAPTATGIETLVQLRSPAAPRSHTLDLELPSGAILRATDSGGAEVMREEKRLLGVAPPTAIDAAGAEVPVSLNVEGNSLLLLVSPDPAASYPIVVDPLFQTYEWYAKNTRPGFGNPGSEEWVRESVASGNALHTLCSYVCAYAQDPPLKYEMPGLYVQKAQQNVVNDRAAWFYAVPRFFSDQTNYGERPQSFISKMTLSNLVFRGYSSANSPYLNAGLWDPNNGWVSLLQHLGKEGHGLTDMAYQYQFLNQNQNVSVKTATAGLFSLENNSSGSAQLYVGTAIIELNDNNVPAFGSISGPAQWVNQIAKPISFTISDAGLGVYALQVGTQASSGPSWKTKHGCVGVGGNPCPRTWASASAGLSALKYEPAVLPQGVNTLKVTAEDPLGKLSEVANVQVKVDHSGPALNFSGTATEQSTLGSTLPEYSLKYTATDGDDAAATALAPIGSAGTGPGQMQRPMGVAVDSSNNIWVVDRENNRVQKFDKNGALLMQFGGTGAGNGQFSDPRGIAISNDGTVWISEAGNRRVQAFTSDGVFIRKFTSAQFTLPWGIAVGAENTLWVSDGGGHKVLQFSSTGAFIRQAYGSPSNPSGPANFNWPTGISTDKSGNLWVPNAVGNNVMKFDANGKFVLQFGAAGTGNGQFRGPHDIAVARSGNVLVIDDQNNRVQVFQPNGTYLRQFGVLGTGSGQLKEPRGIAIGADNTAYVADAGNRRIARWNHADQDPQSGVAKTEVKVDGALVEPAYTPGCSTKNCSISREWTLDAGDYAPGQHSVEVIATDAVGLATTKTLTVETHGDLIPPNIALSGSMTQQASLGTTRPAYTLKVDATDPGSAEERKSGVASTTVKVDGEVVDATAPGCPAGSCSITREWTLQADSYSPGPHDVVVTATDAAGRTATKTLAIEIERDTTAPVIEVFAPFYTAPSGWLEQKSYGVNAFADDENGYGITSLALKIDGEVVKSNTQNCPSGGCSGMLGFGGIDMSAYDGGAHPAELIATDGAGNWKKRSWTINVDPEGHVSSAEAIATLEAVDETSGSTLVAATEDVLEPGQIEAGDNPGLQLDGSSIESTGIPNTTTMTIDLEDGFTIQSPDGKTTITPAVADDTSSVIIAEDVAGVAANTSSEADSIIRPQYNGVQTFQAIRSATSPYQFSWEVQLAAGQTLELVDSQHAVVLYEDRSTAFLISTEGAHDATGKEVPTHLEVAGSVLTLTVSHSAEFTYPVVAGQGWETSYNAPHIVERPLDEAEKKAQEEEEKELRELEEENYNPPPPTSDGVPDALAKRLLQQSKSGHTYVPAPPYPAGGGEASASRIRSFELDLTRCGWPRCTSWDVTMDRAWYERGLVWARWANNTSLHCATDIKGAYDSLELMGSDVERVDFLPPFFVAKTTGHHLLAYCQYHLWILTVVSGETHTYRTMFAWVWPNGFQESRDRERDAPINPL